MCGIDSSTTGSRSSKVPFISALRRIWGRWGDERGSNLIEITFVAMFMFGLVAGIVDIGGAFHDYIIVVNASREGARTYSRLPCKSDNRSLLRSAILNSALTEANSGGLGLTSSNVTITPNPTSACPVGGDTISVGVRVDYHSIFGDLFGADNFPIRGQATMVFYGNDGAQNSQ